MNDDSRRVQEILAILRDKGLIDTPDDLSDSEDIFQRVQLDALALLITKVNDLSKVVERLAAQLNTKDSA